MKRILVLAGGVWLSLGAQALAKVTPQASYFKCDVSYAVETGNGSIDLLEPATHSAQALIKEKGASGTDGSKQAYASLNIENPEIHFTAVMRGNRCALSLSDRGAHMARTNAGTDGFVNLTLPLQGVYQGRKIRQVFASCAKQ